MQNNTPSSNDLLEMFLGFLSLLAFHAIAMVFIVFGVGYVVNAIFGGYSIIAVWAIGAMGFFLWQLFYVIPLVIWLKRRGKTAMMKGVIIGAVLTALVNGACYLAMAR